jgi:hypothetical protein
VGDRIFWESDKVLKRMGNMLLSDWHFVPQNLTPGLPPPRGKSSLAPSL